MEQNKAYQTAVQTNDVPTVTKLRAQAEAEIKLLHQTKLYLDIMLTGTLAQSHVIADQMLSQLAPEAILYPQFYLSLALKLEQAYLLMPFLSQDPHTLSSLDSRYILTAYVRILDVASKRAEFKEYLAQVKDVISAYHPVLYHQLGYKVILVDVRDLIMVAILTNDLTLLPVISQPDYAEVKASLGPLLAELNDIHYGNPIVQERGYISIYISIMKHLIKDPAEYETYLETFERPADYGFYPGETVKIIKYLYERYGLNDIFVEELELLIELFNDEADLLLLIDETFPVELVKHLGSDEMKYLNLVLQVNTDKPIPKAYIDLLPNKSMIDATLCHYDMMITALGNDVRKSTQPFDTWYSDTNEPDVLFETAIADEASIPEYMLWFGRQNYPQNIKQLLIDHDGCDDKTEQEINEFIKSGNLIEFIDIEAKIEDQEIVEDQEVIEAQEDYDPSEDF